MSGESSSWINNYSLGGVVPYSETETSEWIDYAEAATAHNPEVVDVIIPSRSLLDMMINHSDTSSVE